ncbi:MAG: RNA ligase [Nitrosopumilus sp.]
MTFPTIRNISDVFSIYSEERLKDLGFVVIYKDTYTIIDYVVSKERTFETPLLRELRGIKFAASTGDIISRPLHKFFNVGESSCPITDLEGCEFYEKLDGSMIATTSTGLMMTRKGHSDQAQAAIVAMNEMKHWRRYHEFNQACDEAGETAIFEYTAPTNRIVVKYDKPELRLIAIRNNITGEYLDYEFFAIDYGIPYAHKYVFDYKTNVKEWIDEKENFEGLVLRRGDEFAKVKNADYVLRHRAMDGLRHEKDVLLLVVDGCIDDFMGLLADEDLKERLLDYEREVVNRLLQVEEVIWREVLKAVDIYETRKEMAMFLKKNLHKQVHGVAFKLLDSLSKSDENIDEHFSVLTENLKNAIRKSCSSGTKVEIAKEYLLEGVPQWVN